MVRLGHGRHFGNHYRRQREGCSQKRHPSLRVQTEKRQGYQAAGLPVHAEASPAHWDVVRKSRSKTIQQIERNWNRQLWGFFDQLEQSANLQDALQTHEIARAAYQEIYGHVIFVNRHLTCVL